MGKPALNRPFISLILMNPLPDYNSISSCLHRYTIYLRPEPSDTNGDMIVKGMALFGRESKGLQAVLFRVHG